VGQPVSEWNQPLARVEPLPLSALHKPGPILGYVNGGPMAADLLFLTNLCKHKGSEHYVLGGLFCPARMARDLSLSDIGPDDYTAI